MGQRPNRPKTKVVADPKYYFELLTSAGVKVTNVNLVNDEVVEMYECCAGRLYDGASPHQIVQGHARLGSARVLLRYR